MHKILKLHKFKEFSFGAFLTIIVILRFAVW